MKILMTLANPFTQDPRVYNESISLIKVGHKVTVLGWDKRNENPPIEIRDGIDIIRSYNTEFMQLLPYDIFRLHFWWNKGYKDAFELHKKNHFDVIHCHDLDTLSIGIKLKKKFGLPLIYDAHEIWGYMVAKDLPEFWAKYYLQMEKKWLKDVDYIVTVNEPLKDYFRSISNKPITIIMNCKELHDTKYEKTKNDRFTLLYLGLLSKGRFIFELLDVVKDIHDIYCIIGGKGKPEYFKAIKDKCSILDNIDFIGTIPMDKVLPMTKKSDLIVCLFDPNSKNNQVGLPNKVFEAIVSGRPIICTKGIYSGNFVEKEKCGLAVDYNKQSVRETIIELRDNPKLCERLGKNGIKVAEEKYNWKKQAEKLIKIYKELIK